MADAIVGNLFLVNAPAGSGKTTWIRKSVRKYLLQNPNDNVLCITYTNRAAEELGKDVDSNRVYFGTIHSFINDFIGSFFSHESILELYWEVYKNQIVERIENVSQNGNWAESNTRYIEKYGGLTPETVRSNITTDIGAMVKKVKEVNDIPCAVGFGISTPEHVKQALEIGAKGAIAGSACVKIVEKNLNNVPKMLEELEAYVHAMKEATRA